MEGSGNDTMYYVLYDPILGRFLSPDPFVQAPGYPNSYNRYTYALNNPLRFIDPSGYYKQQTGSFVIDDGTDFWVSPVWGSNVCLDENGNWQIAPNKESFG